MARKTNKKFDRNKYQRELMRRRRAKGRVSDKELPEAEDLRKHNLKLISGVYLLYHEGELVYVGQSFNIIQRIWYHTRDIEFDSYSYISANAANIDRIEEHYITKYQPRLNKDGCGDRPYSPPIYKGKNGY